MTSTKMDWQLGCLNLIQRTSHILRSQKLADCTFLVGEEIQPIRAHRLLLAIASPVFEAMLFGDMAENKSIIVTDMSPECFNSMLEYLYTNELKLHDFKTATNLFYASKKYMIQGLTCTCVNYLRRNLTSENVCEIYEMGTLFEEKDLLNCCEQRIMRETKLILATNSFLLAQPVVVEFIFSLDNLNISSELDLLYAAERYAEYRRNKIAMSFARVVTMDAGKGNESEAIDQFNDGIQAGLDPVARELFPAISKIRFLTLSLQQLAAHLPQCSLLPRGAALQLLLASAGEQLDPALGLSSSKVLRTREQVSNQPAKPYSLSSEEKSEVCLFYVVKNVSGRSRLIESSRVELHDVWWYLAVQPSRPYDPLPRTLDVYLRCDDHYLRHSTREFLVDCTIKIVAQRVHGDDLTRTFSEIFRSGHNRVGCSFPWETIRDPARGLYHQNSIALEVHLGVRPQYV